MRRSRGVTTLLLALSFMNLHMKCEPRYQIERQQWVTSSSGDIRFIGDVTLTRHAQRSPPKLELRYYSDSYQTMISSSDQGIADTLKKARSSFHFDFSTTSFLVGSNGKTPSLVCAMFRMQHSNFPEWSPLGCLSPR